MGMHSRARRARAAAEKAVAEGQFVAVVAIDDAYGDPGRRYAVTSWEEPFAYFTNGGGERYTIEVDATGAPVAIPTTSQ